MKRGFVTWWIIALTFAVTLFWAGYFGVLQNIWRTDVTHFTTLIFGIFVAVSGIIGWNTYRLSEDNHASVDKAMALGWFASLMCTSIGLLGTVIGLSMMVQTQVAGVNPGDPNALMSMIGHVMSSLGTALYTTAVGIGTGIALQIQCFNLQHVLKEYRDEE